jgi:hypothetical protein
MPPTPQVITLPSLSTSFTLLDKLILDNYVDPTVTGEFIVEVTIDVETINRLFGIYANVADVALIDITKLKFNIIHPGDGPKTPNATSAFTGIFPKLTTALAKGSATPVVGVHCDYVDHTLYPLGKPFPEVLLQRIFHFVTTGDAPASRKNEPVGVFNKIGFINTVDAAADLAFGGVLKAMASSPWQTYNDYTITQDTGGNLTNQASGNIIRKLKGADPDRFLVGLVENTAVPSTLKKLDGSSEPYTVLGVTIDANNKIYKNLLIVGDKIRIPFTCIGNSLQTYEKLGATPSDPTTTTVVPNIIVIYEITIVA